MYKIEFKGRLVTLYKSEFKGRLVTMYKSEFKGRLVTMYKSEFKGRLVTRQESLKDPLPACLRRRRASLAPRFKFKFMSQNRGITREHLIIV